jgi:hypothetical protein
MTTNESSRPQKEAATATGARTLGNGNLALVSNVLRCLSTPAWRLAPMCRRHCEAAPSTRLSALLCGHRLTKHYEC